MSALAEEFDGFAIGKVAEEEFIAITRGMGRDFPEFVRKRFVVRAGKRATAGAFAECALIFGNASERVESGDGTAVGPIFFAAADGVIVDGGGQSLGRRM